MTRHAGILRAGAGRLATAVALLTAVALAGCTASTATPQPSSSADAADAGTVDASVDDASGEPTDATSLAPPVGECGEASQELLDGIAVNARPEGTFTPLTGAFIEAANGIYVVAIRFEGLDGEVLEGAWTAVGVEPPTPPYLSATEDANLYTAWETVLVLPGYAVTLDDPAIPAALDCLPT